jgi:DNA modification methylase
VARAVVLRAEARNLPLPDAKVDLIVTSPPYYLQRLYEDDGKPLAGQIGSEKTPQEYLDALIDCTREWMRVLKPEGSLFVNLGDKFAQPGKGIRNQQGTGGSIAYKIGAAHVDRSARDVDYGEFQGKSLMGLPWRYALRCMDELGLILRRDIIWHKSNGLPESANDRCRSSHEYLFHLVKQPRYYSAIDEIREPHSENTNTGWTRKAGSQSGNGAQHRTFAGDTDSFNPLGKLPGSVWTIPSEPLSLPAYLGIEHYAAFPTALPRKVILGWSPPAICLECGEGRRPVVNRPGLSGRDNNPDSRNGSRRRSTVDGGKKEWEQRTAQPDYISGYACACTPYTDHPGTGEPSGPDKRYGDHLETGGYPNVGAGWGGKSGLADRPRVGPWREYHLDGWTPPTSHPARVLDPFGGTGTTALTAVAHGRDGITADLGADYCRAAQYRLRDGAERAKARGQAKPPPAKRVREDLYGGIADELDALLEESS